MGPSPTVRLWGMLAWQKLRNTVRGGPYSSPSKAVGSFVKTEDTRVLSRELTLQQNLAKPLAVMSLILGMSWGPCLGPRVCGVLSNRGPAIPLFLLWGTRNFSWLRKWSRRLIAISLWGFSHACNFTVNTEATSNKKQINQISSSSHVSVFWGKDTGLQKVVLEKRAVFVFISYLCFCLPCNHF